MTHHDDTLPDFKTAPPPLTDADPCGLKPYKNTPLCDVPVSYFEWMVLQQQYAPRVNRGTQWLRVMQWIRNR